MLIFAPMMAQELGPTTEKERHLILDILRGLALAEIALANFPEFALWTFLSPDEQAMMPTAEIDKVVRFLQFAFVDGKFYTIFSMLFGVGFSLILARRSVSLFMRRMLILACIGFCHLMFIWSGDILLLYAVGGLLLPLFIKMKDKVLMVIAGMLIFVPVVLTCYIMQSVIGAILFYGLGFGLGTTFGLITIELTAVIVFLFQIAVCKLWLHYFRFGPLEWIWRMLTYGRYFPISRSA